MSDRICIKSNGTLNVQLSAAHITACDPNDTGCGGGWLNKAYEFYEKTGIVSGGDYNTKQGCWPYPFKPCEHSETITSTHYPICPDDEYPTPKCVHKCQASYKTPFNKDRHFGQSGYPVTGVDQIKNEIFKNGPVSAGFAVFDDFFAYTGGIYNTTQGVVAGHHAIKIFGWGEAKGIKYWYCSNSWNPDWGMKGFFKIEQGICEIEESVYASLPRLK